MNQGSQQGDHICELCTETKPLTKLDLAAYKCKECKRDLDSLSRMATRQGHVKWYQDVMKLPASKKRYRLESCSQKKKTLQLLTIVQKFTVTVANDNVAKGKMM